MQIALFGPAKKSPTFQCSLLSIGVCKDRGQLAVKRNQYYNCTSESLQTDLQYPESELNQSDKATKSRYVLKYQSECNEITLFRK